MNANEPPIITKSRLIEDLQALGVHAGQVVMLHASVKNIGWVVGGPETVLQALLEVLTPTGTLMMVVAWEDNPYELQDWPPERQQAYLEECPAFDPETSRADHRLLGILSEYIRTMPGAVRSEHPQDSVVAIGAQAYWLTEQHPLQYGYGPESPLGRLCKAGGQVLMLGAPLDTLTVLHYAEHISKVPNKQVVRYRMPILRDDERVWVDLEEFDTAHGIVDWAGEDYFKLIGQAFLDSGQGRTGKVGAATSYLFDATALTWFGVEWLETTFGREE
jgi:aminoglycoside 3-N-acetyltransferase